jgi:hypothetical protein
VIAHTGAAEAALDDSSARQQQEASFCHRMLDHFEPQAVLLGDFGSVRPV